MPDLETGRDETQNTAAVDEAGGTSHFSAAPQQTSHSGWLDRLGTATGAGICFFNVHQRSRLKQRREEERGSGGGSVSEAISVTSFSAAASDKGVFLRIG